MHPNAHRPPPVDHHHTTATRPHNHTCHNAVATQHNRVYAINAQRTARPRIRRARPPQRADTIASARARALPATTLQHMNGPWCQPTRLHQYQIARHGAACAARLVARDVARPQRGRLRGDTVMGAYHVRALQMAPSLTPRPNNKRAAWIACGVTAAIATNVGMFVAVAMPTSLAEAVAIGAVCVAPGTWRDRAWWDVMRRDGRYARDARRAGSINADVGAVAQRPVGMAYAKRPRAALLTAAAHSCARARATNVARVAAARACAG